VSVCLGAARAETSWRDIETRIQYGYYTEDAPALRSLEDAVAADESHDKLHGYYAGLLAWRLAQLGAPTGSAGQGASAAQLAQRCVSEADAALAEQGDFAEALALRAACLATPLGANGSQSSYAAHRARRDIGRALQLAGRNPRVLLIDAMNDYQLAPRLGGNKERASTCRVGALPRPTCSSPATYSTTVNRLPRVTRSSTRCCSLLSSHRRAG
jgi:hypothetical protein